MRAVGWLDIFQRLLIVEISERHEFSPLNRAILVIFECFDEMAFERAMLVGATKRTGHAGTSGLSMVR